ncbi:RDD family protein [Actinokineospora iranica]|uniref:Uncharacterized membrane protein YckC, RDD family n=1 Tax=Actinokineospora iranica TaxID=1271860 RepID=A0A1G6YNA5_9PSEU|nr:RDD family protein [Actinokineospora iranica]SDD91125.1 Uncharacterized membrane protein YckC, RDD family [Actinokineospora iranica]
MEHRPDIERVAVGARGVVPLATLGARVGARLIDTTVVGVPAVLAVLSLPGLTDPVLRAVAIVVAVSLVGFVYDTTLVGARGTTPGKKILGVEIAHDATGDQPGWKRAAVRAAVLWVFPLICFLTAAYDERRLRGLHDWAAGTVVILA